MKKMEALSYLGDDAGVREVFETGTAGRRARSAAVNPHLFHVAAVAEAAFRRCQTGKQHWEQALKLAPGLDVVSENLADARLPIGERHGPWAFELRR